MPNGELARVVERMRQARETRTRELAAAAPLQSGALQIAGSPFAAGDRVFDVITGLEGEVLGGTRENVVVPVTRQSNG